MSKSKRNDRLWRRSDTPLGSVAAAGGERIVDLRMRRNRPQLLLLAFDGGDEVHPLGAFEFRELLSTGDFIISTPLVDRISGGRAVAARIDLVYGLLPSNHHVEIMLDRVESGELGLTRYLLEIAVGQMSSIRDRCLALAARSSTEGRGLSEQSRLRSISTAAFEDAANNATSSGREPLATEVVHLANVYLTNVQEVPGPRGEFFKLWADATSDLRPPFHLRRPMIEDYVNEFLSIGDTDTAELLEHALDLDNPPPPGRRQ